MFDLSSIAGRITGNAVFLVSNGISSLQKSLSTLPANQSILISIGTIIVVAALFACILKVLKQELILGYILAGLIIGPLVLGLVRNTSLISALAEIGIAFLLFVTGLEISASKLKETRSSFFAGLIQIIVIGAATFFISRAIGFALIESFYLALIIAFSSTIVVIKLLADNNELSTLHGRIAVSILVLQDLAAVIALAVLSSSFSTSFIITALLKLLLIMLIAFFLNKTVLGPLFKFASSSTELLFLVSIAFVFLFSGLAYILNLSIVIGAFIAGLAIANLPYKLEIESKIRPLRDFFAIIFFVSLGTWLTTLDITKSILPFIIFLAFVIVVKPFITAAAVRIFGYKTRTSILSGISLAQISEFSLILALQGLLFGVIMQETFNMIVLIAIITMALSPYFIKASSLVYGKTASLFNFLDGVTIYKDKEEIGHRTKNKKGILLFGCHRMGTIFLKALNHAKENLMVIDYNPDIIRALTKQNISCIYGDSRNDEILECLSLKDVNIVISTIPDINDNILLIAKLKQANPKIFILVTAEKIHDALKLYNLGADYVILPQVISGEKGLNIVKEAEKISQNKEKFAKIREEHVSYLKDLHRFLY